MQRESDAPQRKLPKLARNMQSLSVVMQTRDLLGIHPANQPGLRPKCFRRKSSPCSCGSQHLLFGHKLEFPGGMQAGFARATAPIHGTGRRWRNWLELSRDAFV